MVQPLTSCAPAELLARARALVADAVIGAEDAMEALPLGDVRLRSGQRDAVRRVRRLLERHGGAILADHVGAGKTFVALAVARRYENVVVAAPAALRDMWDTALRQTTLAARFVSYEQLSRGRGADASPGFVILDEAHHLRNPKARRHTAAAALCRRAPALLLSATPLQNRVDDLVAQLSLFLGSRADALAPHQMATFIVRTATSEPDPGLPRLDGPHLVGLDADDDCLDLLLALPPPLPAADEGDGGILLVYSLVQQWASSRAALLAALRRRLARAVAFGSALESGHRPSRSELAAWSFGGDAIQLAFPELVVQQRSAPADLLACVRAHEAALRHAIARLGSGGGVDAARVEAVRRLRARHEGERIIAFSQFAETVQALGRALARDGHVAWLTARGGHLGAGTISRRDLLAQFSPGSRAPPEVERVELLLTTDVLSEGLNLQEASVVVHLDLPWNPARVEQRVGRVRRLGARQQMVTVYALAPPAGAERLLRLEERLTEKLRLARRTVGALDMVLPAARLATGEGESSEAEELGRIQALASSWRAAARAAGPRPSAGDATAAGDASPAADATPVVAAVRAAHAGFLALVAAPEDGGDARLVARLGDAVSERAGVVRRALEAASTGEAVAPDATALARATADLRAWCAGERAADAVDLGAAISARARREAVARLQRICASAPRHRRAVVSKLAASARAALVAPITLGAERELSALAAAPMDDEPWLRALMEFAADAAHGVVRKRHRSDTPPLRALVLLQP